MNISARKTRPVLHPDTVCQVFVEYDLMEIGFLSKCCRNDTQGSCIMCDYGCAVETKSEQQYISEMIKILDSRGSEIKTLLLCTNGSFFDEFQIPLSLFRSILITASKYKIPTIEFETHYRDVTVEKLDMIKSILHDRQIMIELGLETVNPIFHETFIMKNIDLDSYEKTMRIIQEYRFTVETNIMVGLPFLSIKEQFEDAQKTIQWALERQCKIVLFPINIKPHTLLMKMYELNLYTPVSHWLLLFILDNIPEHDLDKITIAWYGNREEPYDDDEIPTIFPKSCPKCGGLISEFYASFIEEKSSAGRKTLIHSLKNNVACDCMDTLFAAIAQKDDSNFEERYRYCINTMKQEYFGEKGVYHV